jgi:transcriptional antiterminator RfaH
VQDWSKGLEHHMPIWVVAQTITGRENFTASRVAEKGFETFLPKTMLPGDSLRPAKIAAVFPGYFFAQIEARWRAIANTLGVIGLIMAGDSPARCPDADIARLKAAQMPNGLIRLPTVKAKRNIAPGSKIRILSGPFRGLNALYEGQSAKDRERVLLEILGRNVPVELGSEEVSLASNAKS